MDVQQKNDIQYAFSNVVRMHCEEKWHNSVLTDTQNLKVENTEWLAFRGSVRVRQTPEECRDFLMDISQVQRYESLLKESSCLGTFDASSGLLIEQRRFVYAGIWPISARGLDILSSTMSVYDLLKEEIISPVQPNMFSVMESDKQRRCYVIASTSSSCKDLHPEVPMREEIIRAHLHTSGFVIIPCDDGSTSLFIYLHVDPKGDLSPDACNQMIGVSVSVILKNIATVMSGMSDTD